MSDKDNECKKQLERLSEMKKAVNEISDRLKGQLSNAERALLVADRRDIRDVIKREESMK